MIASLFITIRLSAHFGSLFIIKLYHASGTGDAYGNDPALGNMFSGGGTGIFDPLVLSTNLVVSGNRFLSLGRGVATPGAGAIIGITELSTSTAQRNVGVLTLN